MDLRPSYLLLNLETKQFEILNTEQVNLKFYGNSETERGIYQLFYFYPNEELDITSIRLYGVAKTLDN